MSADPVRVPPHDGEAEKCVLGAALTNPDALAVAVDRLDEDDFYTAAHRLVFRALKTLYQRSEGVDFHVVRSWLRDQGLLDSVGGMEFLLSLDDYSAAASNIEKHTSIVRDKALLRRVISAATKVQSEAYKQQRPPAEIIETAEQEIYSISLGSGHTEPSELKDIVAQVLEEQVRTPEELEESGRRIVKTHYFRLDEMTTGFHPGEFVIIAGRPSMGKSSLILSMAAKIAAGPPRVPCAVFSLEMSREQCATNILCGFAKVPVQELRRRQGLAKEYRRRLIDAAGQLEDLPLIIDDSVSLSPAQLRSRARRLKSRYDIGAIFIDYLQLMQGNSRFENRQQEVAEISRGLKLLAKELSIPIIAGSQISREAEAGKDQRPRLSHLRESGAIEQDADVVLLLYRDEYYNREKTKEPGVAEVIVAKQRNGPTGTIKLAFLKEYTLFENHTSAVR